MASKPFRPPLLNRLPPKPPLSDQRTFDEPETKRRRISDDKDDDPQIKPKYRTTLNSESIVKDGSKDPPLTFHGNNENVEPGDDKNANYYNVLWRKFTLKKHKTWDGDGILVVQDGIARLQDVSGKDLGRTACAKSLSAGDSLVVGGRDVEVEDQIPSQDFLARKPTAKAIPTQNSENELQASRRSFKQPEVIHKKPLVLPPKSGAMRQVYRNPLLSNTVLEKANLETPTPRHDPKAPGALVLRRPKTAPKGCQLVDVVVDPLLSAKLRPHQREGVSFLYECVMGMRPSGEGAILADEMGLGKTLQTISLIWTLLKQNPVYNASPVIKKALIVCPVTLIKNWRKEFKKWLGNERIGVFIVDEAKSNIRDFTMGKAYSVMIIGYERLRLVQEELIKGAGIDLVVADEGHRLKTAKNKSAQAILSLNTNRRIILSGTPIQNDLSEFFVMVDFVNPGLLGNYNSFKRNFEVPIVRSRQPEATKKEIERGQDRSEELADETRVFILRRTVDVISKFLPPKSEVVLFCKPTQAQVDVYRAVLSSPIYGKVLGSPEASLQLITILKKVCNSPSLLKLSKRQEADQDTTLSNFLAEIPRTSVEASPITSSGKMLVLQKLLSHLRSSTDEKVVLVSNYTSTLDVLQSLLLSNGWKFLRLDGAVPSAKRQELVDTFNRTPPKVHFAFLLSAKSGGVGLNLIGASRLILFDVDWNPSTDLQAMARIHRDGQKKPVRIYRLLTAGAMDEKIYQRQLTKQGIADEVMDRKVSAGVFSQDELKDLFRLDVQSICQTHDLLECPCKGSGQIHHSNDSDGIIEVLDSDDEEDAESSMSAVGRLVKASELDIEAQEQCIKLQNKKLREKHSGKSDMQALMRFAHVNTSEFIKREDTEKENIGRILNDDVLQKTLQEEDCRISFVFTKTATGAVGETCAEVV